MSSLTAFNSPDDILQPLTECLTPEVAKRILAVRLSPHVQSRVDDLASKANDGQLNSEERAEYEALIEKADLLGVFKAIARQVLAGS